MGTPQEMAIAVVFMASPAARFVTGTNLVVDGASTKGVQFLGTQKRGIVLVSRKCVRFKLPLTTSISAQPLTWNTAADRDKLDLILDASVAEYIDRLYEDG